MSERAAAIRFPDGTERYALYSTFDQLIRPPLYPDVTHRNGRLWPTGTPCPTKPDAPRASPDQLVPIFSIIDGQALSWHGLWCPQRLVVVGPLSPYHQTELPQNYELTDEGHLRLPGSVTALCGLPAAGTSRPFHVPPVIGGMPPDAQDAPPIDLFAGWPHQPACSPCLLTTLHPPAGTW